MSYSDNLDNEPKPMRKKLLPEGWRNFKILAGKETTSKAGNPMFIFTIQDILTQYIEDIYCVYTPGKRWMLKALLSSCGIERNTDGNYNWDIPELVDRKVSGLVEHEPNDFINRNGDTVKTTQHKIVDFQVENKNENNEEKTAWEEES